MLQFKCPTGCSLSNSPWASFSVRSVVRGIQIGCRAIATHRRAVPHHNLKMLFGAQRKLHHAFEQLIRGHASEIEHNQLLGIEPHKVAKLQGLAA
jgi:hypothetical protein